MTFAMMTQTQLEAVNRRKAFHHRIAERAADLIAKKKYIPASDEILSPINDRLIREAWNTINRIDNLNGPRIEGIQRIVAKHFGLTRQDIISDCRTRNMIIPRMLSIFLSRQLTTKSFAEIGRRTGGRDHSTVVYSSNKITALLERDRAFTEKVLAIREEILA